MRRSFVVSALIALVAMCGFSAVTGSSMAAGVGPCPGTAAPIYSPSGALLGYQPIPILPGQPVPPLPTPLVPTVPAGSITAATTGAPGDATAVLANLTMVDAAVSGYITADKCTALASGPQSKSNGNYDGSSAVANLSVVPLDADGRICVYNQTQVNLVVDVEGFFAPPSTGGQKFGPSPPHRVLDTRVAPLVTPGAGSITKVATGVAAGTTAVLVNLTMVDGTTPGYITADVCSQLSPGPQTRSSGNHSTSTAIANLAVVPVDMDGSFCIYNQQPVNLVVDVQGSFTPTAGLQFDALPTTRKLDTRLSLVRPAAGSVTRVSTGVTAGTAAVLVNLTMTSGLATGYITADRCSALAPGPQAKSSGNHSTIVAIANLAVVPVDADGSFCIYNQQPVDLVVDLQGTFSATGTQQFFPIAQHRILDTRTTK